MPPHLHITLFFVYFSFLHFFFSLFVFVYFFILFFFVFFSLFSFWLESQFHIGDRRHGRAVQYKLMLPSPGPFERVVVSLELVLFDSSQLARMAAATSFSSTIQMIAGVLCVPSACTANVPFQKKNEKKKRLLLSFFSSYFTTFLWCLYIDLLIRFSLVVVLHCSCCGCGRTGFGQKEGG